MDGLERVHRLMEELEETIREMFGDFTSADVLIDCEGYRSFTVTEWEPDSGVPTKHQKRRELYGEYRTEDGWRDTTDFQNSYYRDHGVLLEKEAKA